MTKIAQWLLTCACCLLPFFISACDSELIQRQKEQIQEQEAEITRQKQEIQQLLTAKQKEEQKRQDCNQAFRYFEQGQTVKEPDKAVGLYRKGLTLCPDDDVAHYELGNILERMGRLEDGRAEFEAALKINPKFQDAKKALEALQKR